MTAGKGKQRLFEEKMARLHGLPDIYSIRDAYKEKRLELIVGLKVLGYSNSQIAEEVYLDRRRVDRIIVDMVEKGVLSDEQAKTSKIWRKRPEEERARAREYKRKRKQALQLDE